ncbi:MAG: carboxypeptidase regulatory-like domain-containing protein [Flavipsychrobacter sp.]|nr:carboxypeptidase regulatory-like domain-containing protein [Flavipsychrobacter sp.]
MKLFSTLLISASLLASGSAFANTGGSPKPGSELPKEDATVHGYVVDANTKKPVSGVIVSASNQKKNFKKEVSTDASGYFKLDEMPSGEVLIYFDKKGYRMLKKSPVVLKEKTVTKLSIDLREEEELDTVYEHPVLRLLDGIF